MPYNSLVGDFNINGTLSCSHFAPPAASIGDAAIAGSAGIQASKLQHQHEPTYSQEAATNAASGTYAVHVVYGATGTVLDFKAGAAVVLTGNDTCTVDLLKNGASILTSPISLASTDTNYVTKTAPGFSSTSLVAGDVLSVKVTATHNAGALPKGVFAQVDLREDPQ